MPALDRFTVAINQTYYSAVYTNVLHAQLLAEGNGNTVLEDLATITRAQWVDTMRQVQPLSLQYTSVVVRRLAPAISDVYVENFTTAGNKVEQPLPGTCFYLVRYYCEPYAPSSSFHWKVPGVGSTGQNAGNVTDERVVQFEPFITAITGGPYTENANEFEFCQPHRAGDPPNSIRPRIAKVQIDGKVRNLRSRQVYVG